MTLEFPAGPFFDVKVEQTWAGDVFPHWRAKSGNHSLIEAACVRSTGALAYLTLYIIDKKQVREVKRRNVAHKPVETQPVFDRGLWPSDVLDTTVPSELGRRVVDESRSLALTVGKTWITLTLAGLCKIREVLKTGRVRFGLDENSALRQVEIVELTAEEVSAVRKAVSIDGYLPAQQRRNCKHPSA